MPSHEKLSHLIEQVIQFGIQELQPKNQIHELREILVGIYLEFIKIQGKVESDEKFWDTNPPASQCPEYEKILKNVENNFPNFGYYSVVADVTELDNEAETLTANQNDDLTDIIRDLLDVKWRFENTSPKDALYNFHFAMKSHSENHLLNLLKSFQGWENY